MFNWKPIHIISLGVIFLAVEYTVAAENTSHGPLVLEPGSFRHHVEFFNTMEPERIVNHISNDESWAWMKENIPFFECPDKGFEQIYYFRWWSFRKHIKLTPAGHVLTEFLDQVGHSGVHNTISCAMGHHIREGRWLRDQRILDDYARFWYSGHDGKPQPHLHKYSHWGTWALYERGLVHPDHAFLAGLLDDFVRDYEIWTQERGLENGLFWQYDVRDGMEESISGSRRDKNIRPPLNSYLYANALAIARIAKLAGRDELARRFSRRAASIRSLFHELLWDEQAGFFKVRYPGGDLADVREAIGFIPWAFNLPKPGYERAWQQFVDPKGFKAPMGVTTAERRHPKFRSHGVGTCEWDGAVWPFATSQTLVSLAHVLQDDDQSFVTREDYYEALLTYARSHRYRGKPYIGEYLDEIDGTWLKPDSDRSRYYNHSTFCDLVISGLLGVVPREDDVLALDPLLPPEAWDWFCLDNLPYHGRTLTILWDRDGDKYKKGKGFRVFVNGSETIQAERLMRVGGKLP